LLRSIHNRVRAAPLSLDSHGPTVFEGQNSHIPASSSTCNMISRYR
jgi:hypothetical protein